MCDRRPNRTRWRQRRLRWRTPTSFGRSVGGLGAFGCRHEDLRTLRGSRHRRFSAGGGARNVRTHLEPDNLATPVGVCPPGRTELLHQVEASAAFSVYPRLQIARTFSIIVRDFDSYARRLSQAVGVPPKRHADRNLMPGGVKDGVRDELAGEQLDEVSHVRPLTEGEARATSELPGCPDGSWDTGEHELRHGSGTFPSRSTAGWRGPDALLVQGNSTAFPTQLGRQTVRVGSSP